MNRRGVRVAALSLLGLGANRVEAAAADLSIPQTSPDESILSEYAQQAAPDPNPPPYTLLRYNERYDYLADPRNRKDFFDPIKYIPLDAGNPESYLGLGGELRERYESIEHAGFGAGPGDSNTSYLLQRVTFAADLHVNERLRFFAQGLSGIQWGQQETAAPVNQNPIDLQQGFVDYIFGTPTVEGPRLTARAGRFEMSYGSGRLIATRAAPNLPFKFDGLQLIGGHGDSRVYAFLVRPGQEYKYHLDGENDGETFWGVYATTPTRYSLPAKLDAYYLGYRQANAHYVSGTADELRHTIGTRWFGNIDHWSYDWEPVVQFGKFGNREIFAWTLATDTSYTFSSTPWRPRIGLKADVASGDSGKPDERFGGFNPLFFKAGYFNDASIIRPTNVADVHPSLQLVPAKSVTATIAAAALWRYTVKDGVYGPPGNVELEPTPTGSHFIGNTVEAATDFKLGRHLVWSLSYVHLFASNAVSTAGGKDVDYIGTWGTFTW